MDQKNIPPAYGSEPPNSQAQSSTLPPTATSTSTFVTVNVGGSGIPIGGCPVCRNHSWRSSYQCIAWFCLIFFFPLGILIFIMLKDNQCNHCGYAIKHYSKRTRLLTIGTVLIIWLGLLTLNIILRVSYQ